MTQFFAAIALVLATACDKGESARKAEAEVVTQDFRVPVPAGFEVMGEEGLAEMERRRQATIELIMLRKSPPAAAIAIARITGDGDPSNLASCKPLAAAEAAKSKMDMPEVKSFDLGPRKTCRWEFEGPKEVATSTVVRAGSAPYQVACSMHKPDKTARAACDEVVRGFSAPPKPE